MSNFWKTNANMEVSQVATDVLHRPWIYWESMVSCSHPRKLPREETPSIDVVVSSPVFVKALYDFYMSCWSPLWLKIRLDDRANERKTHLFLLEYRKPNQKLEGELKNTHVTMRSRPRSGLCCLARHPLSFKPWRVTLLSWVLRAWNQSECF